MTNTHGYKLGDKVIGSSRFGGFISGHVTGIIVDFINEEPNECAIIVTESGWTYECPLRTLSRAR